MTAWKTEAVSNEQQIVLIISRDVKVVAVWEVLFKLRKCSVIHEKFVTEAIQTARLLSPALIILDLDMSKPEQVALCRELRSSTKGAIFLLASNISEDDLPEYSRAGVDEYMSPAISPISLMAKSMLWLTRHEWIPSREQSESVYA